MADFDVAMDPRFLFALTLVNLGVATVQQLRDMWTNHGADDTDLDAILAEVEIRLARRAG